MCCVRVVVRISQTAVPWKQRGRRTVRSRNRQDVLVRKQPGAEDRGEAKFCRLLKHGRKHPLQPQILQKFPDLNEAFLKMG